MEIMKDAPASDDRVRVTALRTGTVRFPAGWLFRSDATSMRQALGAGAPTQARVDAPVGAFLLEHPRHGAVLVDTGLSARAARSRVRDLGLVNGRFFGMMEMSEDDSVAARLARRGICPTSVRTVLMTHLHGDHTSGMPDFPAATFVTTRAEWRAARRPGASFSGYVRRHLPAERSVSFVDFEEGEDRQGLARTLDYFEDGSVLLVSTSGHTIDHLSVLVQSGRGPVFLLGDAVYGLRNLDEDVLPWRTADDAVYAQTMKQLRAYRDANPETLLVPTHDAAQWRRLEALS
jgi:N-acyl homoserine lactone hydrolase